MRIQDRSNAEERRIIQAVICDDVVCARVAAQWPERDGLFAGKWANLIGSWCVKYQRKYGKAPGKRIETIFAGWAQKINDAETVSLVEKALVGLSDDYEPDDNQDAVYLLDLASKCFNRVQQRKTAEGVISDLDRNDTDAAALRLDEYAPIMLAKKKSITITDCDEAIYDAFAEQEETIIKYNGAAGEFFRGALVRDGFIAILAPEKRGKSFILMDLAFRAMLQRKKVAFFEAGDMSQNQIMKRICSRMSKHPIRPGDVNYPTLLERDEDRKVKIEHEVKHFEHGLTAADAIKARQFTQMEKCKTKKALFDLWTYPTGTLSVAEIESTVVAGIADRGWHPDVIVVDYADLLCTPAGMNRNEPRDQVNRNWADLRALSQKFKCLVVTATQANAASYRTKTLDRWNFSEDKRKLAHVTGMMGLSALSDEKKNGIMRWNWIALRESEYSSSRCLHVATCLPLGNPCVLSCW